MYQKGITQMIYTARYISALGEIRLAARDGGLLGLWLEGQTHFFNSLKDKTEETETPELTQAKTWLNLYFAGERPEISEFKLTPEGSEFQKEVWRLLCEIPYGELTTYGELAASMAALTGKARMSARAVGGAVGHNPISIIIPCHRVVGAGGNLTGYAGGLALKVKLLTHEGVDITRLFYPEK